MESREEFSALNVRDALRQIINLSSLQLDLAFASVMHQNQELAHEVLSLERNVDELTQSVLLHMSLAVVDRVDADRSISIFKATTVADQISNAASEIAKIQLRGLGIKGELRDALLQSDETVALFKVEAGSDLTGDSLSRARMRSGVGFDVIAVKRGFEWHIDPADDFSLLADDSMVVRGTNEAMEILRRFVQVGEE